MCLEACRDAQWHQHGMLYTNDGTTDTLQAGEQSRRNTEAIICWFGQMLHGSRGLCNSSPRCNTGQNLRRMSKQPLMARNPQIFR